MTAVNVWPRMLFKRFPNTANVHGVNRIAIVRQRFSTSQLLFDTTVAIRLRGNRTEY